MQIPPVVKLLLIANLAIFVLQFVFPEALIINMALWPLDLSGMSQQVSGLPTFKLHQLVTYAFLHGNFLHIVLNMYALWMFGSRLESFWGSRDFAVYYLV